MSKFSCCIILVLALLFPVSGCLFPVKGDIVQIPAGDSPAGERALSIVLTYDVDCIKSQDDGQPRGLVVYSLGHTACTPSVEQFATLLASLGYVFAVPDHRDIYKVCHAMPASQGLQEWGDSASEQEVDTEALAAYYSLEGAKEFSNEQLEHVFHYRNVDLFETIEYLTKNETYEFGCLVNKPVFLVGYSLGGWNALMVAGAASVYPDLVQDVTAVICQAPFCGELSEENLRQVSCPIFYLVGTEDGFLPEVCQLYNRSPGDSCLVEIEGANHYVFATDLCGSPVLESLYPDACTEESMAAEEKVNALMAEFILSLTETGELPALEEFETFDPELFTVVYPAEPE